MILKLQDLIQRDGAANELLEKRKLQTTGRPGHTLLFVRNERSYCTYKEH